MTNKIKTLFGSIYNKCTEINYEGAPAFVDDIYTQTVKILTTGTFENTFYVKANELADSSIETFKQITREDPEFFAKAIKFTRNDSLMRFAPIVGLVILSTGDEKAKEYTRKIFKDVIQTPADLQNFVSIAKTGTFRSTGRLVKTVTNKWLSDITEIQAIKYGSDSKSFSLKDIYRVTRPKLNGKANEIARYIVKKELAEDTELTQIKGYETFKVEKSADLIEQYNLPFEVVTSKLATENAWKAIFKAEKLPFMFMLKNLNNAYKYKCLEDPEIVNRIVSTLTDPKRIRSSKQFPYRFYMAIKSLKFNNTDITDALYEALDISVSNFPVIKGNTFVGLDFSGSMSYGYLSGKGSMTAAEISNLFGAAIFKKSNQVELSGFNDRFIPVNGLSRKSKVADLMQKLNRLTTGGGTSLSEPVEFILRNKRWVDNLIIITDSISWFDNYSKSKGCMDYLKSYKRKVNPDIKTIVINIMPYKYNSVDTREANLYQISGWSDSVLKFIPMVINGVETQIEKIKNVPVV